MKVQDIMNAINSALGQHVSNKHNSLDFNRLTLASNSINLHPMEIGKGYTKCQAFSLEGSGETRTRTGYISNFRGSGEEGMIIHGTSDGFVALTSENPKMYTVDKLIKHLKERHSINLALKNDIPLHVISCFGVSNGIYQSFSNFLGRTVIGYGNGGAIAASGELEKHLSAKTSKIKAVKGQVTNNELKKSNLMTARVTVYVPYKN